jgi:hypothetical protein
MLRRTLLSIAILSAMAAPAMADGLKIGGYQYGYGYGYNGSPLVSNNVATNTNVAAGIGNQANQQVFQTQQGGSGKGSLVSNNTAVNTNVAAGIGNIANQSAFQFQSGR